MKNKFKTFISTGRGKIITSAVVVVVAVGVTVVIMSAGAHPSPAILPSSSVTSESSVPFAPASAISEAPRSSSSSSGGLSVVINKNSSSSKAAPSSNAAASKPTSSTLVKTQPEMLTSSVVSSAPKKTTPSSKPSTSKPSTTSAANPYASYKQLDMTDFQKQTATYETDAQNSVDAAFEDKVYDSSNLPRDRMGSTVVSVGSPTLLYAEGEVTLSELRSVLINGKKYIGGGNDKYIVTGVYDNSGISYDRTNLSAFPNGVINSVYAKGFVNNPHSSQVSYSDGYLCTKVSEGGSDAKVGYVRALVFTLKKIS